MNGFLAKTFYGNTVSDWAVSLGIILIAAVVGKTLYWIFKNFFRRLTAKTESRLDDILIDMIEEPIVLAVTAFGIWLGLQRLSFSEDMEEWIGHAFEALIILSLTWLLARLLDAVIREYLVPLAEKSENDLDDQLLPIFRRGTKMAVWSLGIIVASNNAGYDVTAVIAGLGIGGLALAMAAKDTVSNIFGGFTIFTDRPFTINDRIRISGYDGTIREIGLRSTRLQTLSGTIVSIPNSRFADNPVENVSLEPSRKVTLNLGLTYDTTPGQMQAAMDALREITGNQEGLEEKVVVGFNAFGDFAMNLLLIYYIKKDADIVGTQTAINLAILEKFNAEGWEFAFPTQTIYSQSLDAPSTEAPAS